MRFELRFKSKKNETKFNFILARYRLLNFQNELIFAM